MITEIARALIPRAIHSPRLVPVLAPIPATGCIDVVLPSVIPTSFRPMSMTPSLFMLNMLVSSTVMRNVLHESSFELKRVANVSPRAVSVTLYKHVA